MLTKHKKLFNFIRIFIITSLLLVVNLVLAYVYVFNNSDWVHSVSEYADGEVTLVCHNYNCVFIKNDVYLQNTANTLKNTGSADVLPTDIDIYLYSVAEDNNPDDSRGVNYIAINTLSVIEVLLLVLVLFIVSVSIVLLVLASTTTNIPLQRRRQGGRLHDNLRVSVVTAAYHELITPLALVNEGIADLNRLYKDGNISIDTVKEPLDNIIPMIKRVDTAVHQIAVDGLSHTNTVESVLDLINNAMGSIKSIYNNYDFNYTIVCKEVLSVITTNTLCYITVGHIFNTLFKGSLDTNATDIEISGTVKNDLLEIYIMDNGNRRMSHDDISCNTNSVVCSIDTKLPPFINNMPTTNGLCLAKEILESAGGGITLIRTGLEGTVFKVTIPVEPITERI